MLALWSWITAHSAIVAAIGVALLDLVFALNPAAESNGVLHWIFVYFKSKTAPPAPPAS